MQQDILHRLQQQTQQDYLCQNQRQIQQDILCQLQTAGATRYSSTTTMHVKISLRCDLLDGWPHRQPNVSVRFRLRYRQAQWPCINHSSYV